jgi:hypothetical protein
MINTAGKTSYGYAGVVWTLNILPQFFIEPMFGGAVHDGNATATPVPDENTLDTGDVRLVLEAILTI